MTSSDMIDVHITMQGKGGVGKTTASAILAQYLLRTYPDLLCIDIDPVNSSFSDFKALKVQTFEIESDGVIDTRSFDGMIQAIVEHPGPVVVDSGASTFLPLANYLTDSPIFRILARRNRRPVFHTIITGGPGQAHTMEGLKTLLDSIPAEAADMILWINEYHGFGRVKDAQGNENWRALRVVSENMDRFRAVVELPKLNAQTFGADMQTMLTAGLTFDEAIVSNQFEMVAQERLHDLWERLQVSLKPVRKPEHVGA